MFKQLFITLIISSAISAQVANSVILEKKYSELPLKIRIENSGIYGISGFDFINGEIDLFCSDSKTKLEFKNNVLLNSNHEIKFLNYTKSFNKGYKLNLIYKDGKYYDGNEEYFRVNILNRSELQIENFNSADASVFRLTFDNDLAYAKIIGQDKAGNLFILIEKYLNEIPLKISRQVYTLNENGSISSVLQLPNIKYLYTETDLQIDSEGNLYHLFSNQSGIRIIKWQGLTEKRLSTIYYSAEYDYELDYNLILPTNEPQMTDFPHSVSKAIRNYSLLIGEEYVYHSYFCNEDNLAPSNTLAADGDWVRTPAGLVVGENVRVAYKWGGFNTLPEYDAGLANGKYSGDIHTDGVSSYAVGVDCSGFVSRCWQMSYHASTSYMPNITTLYSSWEQLKPGDAIHKVGHVRLFVEHNSDGSMRVVESSGRDWGVSYWTYAPSDLSAYSPRYYKNMENNYAEGRAKIFSARKTSDGKFKFEWSNDTTNVIGYRLYISQDNKTWTQVLDDSTLKTQSVEMDAWEGECFVRVSIVKNDAPDYTESNLSNMMAIINSNSDNKILVVDGFERLTGSWRGPGHNFVGRYAQAILNADVESVQNSEIINGNVSLDEYSALFWILGDESTVDETFNSVEQQKVKSYLEEGGRLFVSGSEIGWDLYYKGDSSDKEFYQNYLKAVYVSDDANSNSAVGVDGSMINASIIFGQYYEEDYPDEISASGGSEVCLKYSNGKGAGIQYEGKFGESELDGKLIHFAFPLETVADDSVFASVIKNTQTFFAAPVGIRENKLYANKFSLEQNYPNPFNPSTIIRYSLPVRQAAVAEAHSGVFVQLKVYDVLGSEVATLVNENQSAGNYQVALDGSRLASGIYFYQLRAGKFVQSRKMMLMK